MILYINFNLAVDNIVHHIELDTVYNENNFNVEGFCYRYVHVKPVISCHVTPVREVWTST